MGDLSNPFGLAVAQLGPISIDDSRTAVVKRLTALMIEAHSRGSKFVVFPELALTTFFPRYWMTEEEAVERFFERSMPSIETRRLFELGAELKIGFYLGYAELTPDGRRFNTSILTDENAKIVGRYRKIHLPGHAHHIPKVPFQHLEKKFFEVGNEGFNVWDTQGVRIGMCICNDRRWAETYRVMALQSAELVVLGYNTPSTNIHWKEPSHLRMFHHLLSLQSNAYQNGLWVAAAAKCGYEDGFHMIGGSAIVSPTGEIVAQTQTEEDELIFANIDLAIGVPLRENMFNFAKHRRTEHYGLIIERTGAGEPLGKAPV